MTYSTLAQLRMETEECCDCHMVFAMPADFRRRALDDHNVWFYCPAGHRQHYVGKNTAQKLQDAEAREVALRDQLHAAEEDAERTRVRLLRDRHRFANGVCPCCNRSFDNVRRHMTTKHPDYDASELHLPELHLPELHLPDVRLRYKCSCGRSFESPHGLAVHQGHSRGPDWADPNLGRYRRHLTVTV